MFATENGIIIQLLVLNCDNIPKLVTLLQEITIVQ